MTKPPNTGGLVTESTASEQLVYEIGDPENYILPDVICDFSNVQFHSVPGESVYSSHNTHGSARFHWKFSPSQGKKGKLFGCRVLEGSRLPAPTNCVERTLQGTEAQLCLWLEDQTL